MSDQNKRYDFLVQSMVSHRTGEGMVSLTVGEVDLHVQLTREQARTIAFNLLSAAEAATADAWLVSFMRDRIGMLEGEMGQVLGDFRAWREERDGIQEKD